MIEIEYVMTSVKGAKNEITLLVEDTLYRLQEQGYRYVTWTLYDGDMCLLSEREIHNNDEERGMLEINETIFGTETAVAWQLPCFCKTDLPPSIPMDGTVIPIVTVSAGYALMMNVGDPAVLVDVGTGQGIADVGIMSIRKTVVSRLTPGDTWFMARMVGVEDHYDPEEVVRMYFGSNKVNNDTPVSVTYVMQEDKPDES